MRRSNNLEMGEKLLRLGLEIRVKALEIQFPGQGYQTVYHYTSASSVKAISGHLKTAKPKKGNPEGVYFSTLPPGKIDNYKAKLGLTRVKTEYVIVMRIPAESIRQLAGGRRHVVYTKEDVFFEVNQTAFIQVNPDFRS